ncbi:N-acetylmuramoyl-L-alanine amidase [Sediminicoccus sp. KRV36]|uniref:N-acetylmuramoyl-L-alanine amidase n=1 Tax=Sediminicoccus sp. KRV36 TaxID=3133721 RepID=UPI00200D8712|nr:N-acetylmuramoyl-L-alanine amidase [Sediminicoccus rosea]UPY38200.1 N-acetylmuramoyl-L-alanine amidase [Sediminicoccus rosea]
MTLRLIEAPSPNTEPRPDDTAIDTLILHYTGMRTGEEAIARLRDPAAIVSAHYVVEEDGGIFRLVPEGLRARHAGISHWRGRSALNANSIGIEIVNPGHEWGYRHFPAMQMAALADLCLDILARHPIPPRNVVGHSDVSPDRKQDPGELFDWEGLAANGIGLWPRGDGPAEGDALELLGRIGYRTDLPLPILLTAFQRHWRQEEVNGLADAGTLGRLQAVAALTEA